MRPDPLFRPKVPIDAGDWAQIHERPEELGFAPELSEAGRLRALLHEGLLARREGIRRAERIASYQAWALDEDGAITAKALLEDIRAQGGVLGGVRGHPVAQPRPTRSP